jgi:hypothetical protein
MGVKPYLPPPRGRDMNDGIPPLSAGGRGGEQRALARQHKSLAGAHRTEPSLCAGKISRCTAATTVLEPSSAELNESYCCHVPLQ